MNKLFTLVVFLFLLSCHETDDDWRPLFQENGGDWTETGNASWSFQNDELFGKSVSDAGFVVTNNSFGDFQMSFEFFPDSVVNSGVFIRCGKEINPISCYELNIWDHHVNPDFRTGAVVTLAKPLAHIETIGKWNTYLIKAEGDHLQAWINDVQMVDLRDTLFQKGTIALQVANMGEVKFRKVRIKEFKGLKSKF